MILILTGPPAAGKSTVGPLIAHQLAQCAVVDVDQVRAMVVQPHVAPWRGTAGQAQLQLGAHNGCALAHNLAAAGYHVILLDVLTAATAAIYHTQLAALPHQIVLLLPTLATVLQRNQQRGQWLTDDEVRLLYGWQEQLSVYDRRIDNTHLPAAQLAAELAQLFPEPHYGDNR